MPSSPLLKKSTIPLAPTAPPRLLLFFDLEESFRFLVWIPSFFNVTGLSTWWWWRLELWVEMEIKMKCLEEKGGEFRFGTNITFPKIDCRLARCCKKNSQLIFCHSGSSTCQVCPLFHCLLLLPTVATTATVRSFWPPPVLFFLPANDLSVIGLMEEGQTAFHHHRHHHCHYHFVIVIVIINPLGNY